MPRSPLYLLILAITVLSTSAALADWTASGTFRYTDRTYQMSGFTGTQALPVREADVEIFDLTSQALLATGKTDQSGGFSIFVADGATRNVGVRVVASTSQTVDLDYSVVDDLNSNAIYFYHDTTTDRNGHASGSNVNFGTMTMPAAIGSVSTTNWSSQVFNTLDLCIRTADWIASVDGQRPLVGMFVAWNPTQGRTGSSYSGGSNRMNLSDDDGYDDPNILHEIGHYVEDEFGRSRNTGGSHTSSDDDQDPRLSWSEGFATYVSAAVLDHHGLPLPNVYIDRGSFSTTTSGFGYDFELARNGGATNEGAVTGALWDLIDSSSSRDTSIGTDDDTLSGLGDEVWETLEQMRIENLPATSLEDFWDLWRQLGHGSESGVQAAFAAHRIYFQQDNQEPNDTPETAATINSSYQLNHFYKSGSEPGGDEDWFKFSATAGTYYRVGVNGSGNTIYGRPDPEMYLLDTDARTVLAYNNDPHDTSLNSSTSNNNMLETVPEILWRAPASGIYYVYCRHTSHPRNLGGRYGSYNIRATTVTGVPTPSISNVAAQVMRPGQKYKILVVGTNFAEDAVISVSSSDVNILSVDVIATSGLVAELEVQPGATNGTFSLTVTNPFGTGDTFSSAISISDSARPPLMITEMNPANDRVEIRNMGTVAADMTGWSLVTSMPNSQTYTFPSFSLGSGATVVVSETSGTDTATNLFDRDGSVNFGWGSQSRGDVSLVDDQNLNVDYIRVIGKYTDTFSAPSGSGASWLQPAFKSPPSPMSVNRSETTAYPRTTIGLSGAGSTLPNGAGNRDNAVDSFEPNDSIRQAPLLSGSDSLNGLAISTRPSGFADEDWLGLPVLAGDTVSLAINFVHGSGDLDLEIYAPGEEETPLALSTTTTDNEGISLGSAQTNAAGSGVYRIRIFAKSGGANAYSLVLGAPQPLSVPDLTSGSDLGASDTDNFTADATPDFSGSATPGSTVDIHSSLDGLVGSGTTNAFGEWLVTTSTLTEGNHLITAEAAGISSPGSLNIQIDTTPPPQPNEFYLSANSDTGNSDSDGITNDNTPTFHIDAATEFDTLNLSANGTLIDSRNSTESRDFNVAPLPDGSHLFEAFAVDEAGNPSTSRTLQVMIDTRAPRLTLDLAAGQSTPSTSGPARFSASFDEDVLGFDSDDVSVGGGGISDWNVSGGPANYTITANFTSTEGFATVSLATNAAEDAAGNTSGTPTIVNSSISVDIYGSSFEDAAAIPLTGGFGSNPGFVENGDIDSFVLTLDAPRKLVIQTISAIDTYGRLLLPGGEVLNVPHLDDNRGADDNFLIFITVEAGEYVIEVSSRGLQSTGSYLLDIDASESPFVQPDLAVGLTAGNAVGDDIYNTDGQSLSLTSYQAGVKNGTVTIENDGEVTDDFIVSASPGNSVFGVQYSTWRDGNITAQLIAGNYRVEDLAPGETAPPIVTVISPSYASVRQVVTRKVKGKKKKKKGKKKRKKKTITTVSWLNFAKTLTITARSEIVEDKSDSVQMNLYTN